jgi:hypothetical protein
MNEDDDQLPNSAIELAQRICTSAAAAIAHQHKSLADALECGRLLIEAKAQLKHGQWGRYLAEHCDMPARTAQVYMAMARNRPAIEEQMRNDAHLSFRKAVETVRAAIQAADDETEREEEPAEDKDDADPAPPTPEPKPAEDKPKAAPKQRRDRAIAEVAALLREAINNEILLRHLQTLLRVFVDEKKKIAEIPRAQRVALVREMHNTFDITLDDLKPIESRL